MESKRAPLQGKTEYFQENSDPENSCNHCPSRGPVGCCEQQLPQRVAQIPAGNPASRDTGRKRSSKSRAELLGKYPKELKAGAATDICTPVFL